MNSCKPSWTITALHSIISITIYEELLAECCWVMLPIKPKLTTHKTQFKNSLVWADSIYCASSHPQETRMHEIRTLYNIYTTSIQHLYNIYTTFIYTTFIQFLCNSYATCI